MNVIKFYGDRWGSRIEALGLRCTLPIYSQGEDSVQDRFEQNLHGQIRHLQELREQLSQKIARAQSQKSRLSQAEKKDLWADYARLEHKNKFLKLIVEQTEKSRQTISANFR